MCLACAFAVVPPRPAPSDGDAIFPTEAVPLPWPDGRAIGGTLTWTGVAGFVLEVDGTRIAFDPFVSRPTLFATLFRRAHSDEAAVARHFGALDAVFVGHTHFDHAMDLPSVARVSPRARIHGGATTTETCRRLGVDPTRLVTVRDAERYRVGPFTVEAIRIEHGVVPVVRFVDRLDLPPVGVPRTPFRWPRGDVFAWRVEVAGRSFHVQGSAGLAALPLARQSPADVLIACLAARAGTPRYLERLGERLRPKVLLPCHHDDFFRPLADGPRPIATLDWPGFLADADRLAASHGTTLVRPALLRPTPI